MAPSGAGNARYAPAFATKPQAAANWRCSCGSVSAKLPQLDLVTKLMGMADAAVVSKTEGIGGLG